MTVAYLFPGQGAQAVGMGKDLYDAVPAAKAIFDEADQALGFSLSQLCFEGPMEDLTQTINTQPAILTASVATLEAARENLGDKGLTPTHTAGHSLGEYSSLVAAGSMTFSDAVKLVRERGRLMQAAGDEQEGTMSAIIGMGEDDLRAICDETGVDMANLNAVGQIAISGSVAGIEAAEKLAEERGARRVVRLNVSAAFHSSLMDPAVPGMRAALEGASISAPTFPVVGNVTAQPLETADEVVDELASQIRSSVQWFRTVEYLRDNGVTTFIELGPGKVLTGLVKRAFEEAETINVGNLEELEALRA
ncbi:MAG: ACP S-malonyltransferase [Dehalococcoidia bacterium]|nr:ACP S-malonyltransferase [Dehalococcoidia bacterium]